MFTHCPHCDTCFRVTSEQLKGAQGSVRCGRCFGTFNALEHLVDRSPTEKEKHTPPSIAIPARNGPELTGMPPADTSTAIDLPAPHEAIAERSQQLLEEIQATPVKPARSLFGVWLLIALVLIIVFVGQYVYFNINSLSQNLKLRPLLYTLCNIAPCEVPLMTSPHLITLIERDIRNHPKEKDILQVKAIIKNKAPYVQAYPIMGLSLQDITGKIIAERRFKPSEYLPGNADLGKGMEPQQTVDITLELLDPGKDAVGFEFSFF